MTHAQLSRLRIANTIGIDKAKKIALKCSSVRELDVKLLSEFQKLKSTKVDKADGKLSDTK